MISEASYDTEDGVMAAKILLCLCRSKLHYKNRKLLFYILIFHNIATLTVFFFFFYQTNAALEKNI